MAATLAETDRFGAALSVAAALLGAAGVAAAAVASHGQSTSLSALALIALTHAPVFLALALAELRSGPVRLGTTILAVGVVGFCIDMGLRGIGGAGLGLLAPVLGGTVILGWISLGVAIAIGKIR